MGVLGFLVASSLLPTPQIMTADADIKMISEMLGKPVAIQASLAKKRLYISNPNYPPDKLLAILAAAIHGSIQTSPTGLLLQRTPNDFAELRLAERKERANWIRERLEAVSDYRKRMSAGNTSPSEVVFKELHAKQVAVANFQSHGGMRPASFFPQQLLPSEGLLEALIGRIGIDALASIPAGQTVIYEDAPVDNAHPLPPSGDLIDQYMNASSPYERTSLSQDDLNAIRLMNYGAYFSEVGRETKRPERLRLRVSVTKVNQILQLEGFDGEEKRVLLANFVTSGSMKSRLYTNVASEDKLRSDAQWSPIPKEAQQALDELKRIRSSGGPAPEWLVHPEQNEPLNAFTSGCLQAFAAQTPEKCMVVDVDDFFWEFSRYCCSADRLCITAFQDELDEIEDYERIEDATSIVLRPRTPEAIEASRVDRKVLGKHLRDLLNQSGERLRTLSLLCHDASAERSSMVEALAWFATRIATSNMDGYLGDETYRFLGGISDSGWEQLKAGKSSNVSQEGVTEQLRDLLISEARPIVGEQTVSDLKHHAIELFSKQPVGTAVISSESRVASVVRWKEPGKAIGLWQPIGRLTSLAPQAVERLPNGQFVPVGTPDTFEQSLSKGRQFQTALQTIQVITIRLPLAQRIEIAGSSDIHDLGSLLAYGDLPQALRDKIYQDSVEAQKRQIAIISANARSGPETEVRKVPPP